MLAPVIVTGELPLLVMMTDLVALALTGWTFNRAGTPPTYPVVRAFNVSMITLLRRSPSD